MIYLVHNLGKKVANMKRLEISTKQDIYQKSIAVQMTVGELIILKELSGGNNSKKISDKIKWETRHKDFAEAVVLQDMNTKLYKDLKDIAEKTFKESGEEY